MSEPLKLLVYNPLSTRMGGGGDRWLAEVIPRLVKRGIDVTLMTTSFIPESYRSASTTEHVNRIIRGGARYVEVPCSPLAEIVNHPVVSREAVLHLSQAIGCHDCVYFLNAYAFQDALVWLGKTMNRNTPVISAQHASIFHEHLLHDTYVRTIMRFLLSCFDAYHVLNAEDCETYKRWNLKDIFLIPNGVNTDWFSPPVSKDLSAFRVLHVGRLEHQKGIDVLLESIKLLNSKLKHPPIPEFWICGTGPLTDMVESFAQETSNVSYLGFVSDDELLHRYRESHLFVMSSRRETFGLVAMEAMSCGLPVITSDIPGPRTFVEKSYGRMVPPSQPEAFAQAIERFYTTWKQQPDSYRKMSELARKKCVKEYSWDKIVTRLEDMIRTVTEGQ